MAQALSGQAQSDGVGSKNRSSCLDNRPLAGICWARVCILLKIEESLLSAVRAVSVSAFGLSESRSRCASIRAMSALCLDRHRRAVCYKTPLGSIILMA